MGHRYYIAGKKYPTLEIAAGFLGWTIERAERSVMRNEGVIKLVPYDQ